MLILVISFITGCASSKISRGEAKTYVEDYLGIKNYSISWFKHTNEYSSNAYSVYDEDADLDFDVYGLVGLSGDYILTFSRDISDNYGLKYLEKIDGSLPESFKYYKNGENSELVSFLGGFEITYSNRTELDEACERLWMINNDLKGKTKYGIPFVFKYDDSKLLDDGSGTVPLIDSSFTDFRGNLLNGDEYNDEYAQSLEQLKTDAETRYFTLGAVYNNPDILADLGDDKIEDFINYRAIDVYVVYDVQLGIDQITGNIIRKDEFSRLSEGCVAYVSENHSCRITYGNLYKLLVNEGFTVSGDSEDFTVTDTEGNTYEFANSFIDTQKQKERTYYLCNDERVYTNLDEEIALNHDLILELFGIYVDYDNHFPCLQRDAGLNKNIWGKTDV